MPPRVDKVRLTREQKYTAKLTEAQVDEVRRMYSEGYTQKALGEMFGVRQSTICFIVNEGARQNLLAHARRARRKNRTTEENTAYMRSLWERKLELLKEKEKFDEKQMEAEK